MVALEWEAGGWGPSGRGRGRMHRPAPLGILLLPQRGPRGRLWVVGPPQQAGGRVVGLDCWQVQHRWEPWGLRPHPCLPQGQCSSRLLPGVRGPQAGSKAPRPPEVRDRVELGTGVHTLILTENFQGSARQDCTNDYAMAVGKLWGHPRDGLGLGAPESAKDGCVWHAEPPQTPEAGPIAPTPASPGG